MRRYDLTADIYDERYREEQEAKYKAALENLSLNRSSIVLDVGCGSGLFFSHVADEVEAAVGVDVSRELLRLANQRTKRYQNVFLVLADADYLPFKRELFDLVFAFTIIQNVSNPVETLKELTLAAKVDASFVATGLKAAVSLERFGEILHRAKLQVVSLQDDEALQCYVAACKVG